MDSKPQLSAITFCNILKPFPFEMSLFPSVPSPQKDRKGSILTKEAPTAFIRYGETTPLGSKNSHTQAYTTRELADTSRARACMASRLVRPPRAHRYVVRVFPLVLPSQSVHSLPLRAHLIELRALVASDPDNDYH